MNVTIAGLLGTLTATILAGLPANVVQRERVSLEVRPLNAEELPRSSPGPTTIAVHPDGGGEGELSVVWPDAGETTRIQLRAAELPPSGDKHRVRLASTLTLPTGGQVNSQRVIEVVDQPTTTLFEVYRQGELSLTLGIRADIEFETVIVHGAVVGDAVSLYLEIQRVVEGKVIPLESNLLNTFVGEPVAYSFQLGDHGSAAVLRVQLRPVRIYGDLVQVEIEVSGSLPLDGVAQMISRRKSWTASRGTAHSFPLESGDPPSGYRFLVTPRF